MVPSLRIYDGLPLDYVRSGRHVRKLFPFFSKTDHLTKAHDLIADAHRLDREYGKHVERELGFLRARGEDPGPLISGIVSGKFSERVKDGLRSQAHTVSDLSRVAAAHYAAAGKRMSSWRSAWQRNPRRRRRA